MVDLQPGGDPRRPSGGNVPWREPTVWTSGLSITGTMRLPGKVTSTGSRMTMDQSLRVRRSVTFTFRQSGGGSCATRSVGRSAATTTVPT